MNAQLKQELLNTITSAGYAATHYDWLDAFHVLISNPNAPLDCRDLLTVALKEPWLFQRKPETLNANIEASAALFGVSKAHFTTAALGAPQIFHGKPETLSANIEASAALFGLTKANFTKAALKEPQLF